MPQNTLNFSTVTDIKFQSNGTELKIFVSNTLLGSINQSTPVTLFITETGSTKSITIKTITQAEYVSGNTNDPDLDTVPFSFAAAAANLHVDVCTGTPGLYKTIGIEVDNIGSVCVGTGSVQFFNISAEKVFKAKIETVVVNGANQLRMVVRYAGNIMSQQTSATALCYNGPFCLVCT